MAGYPGGSPLLQGNVTSAVEPQPYGGLQVQESGSSVPTTQRENLPSYIFLVLAAFALALSAVDLGLNYWVVSCGTWLSLQNVIEGGSSTSISDIINGDCYYWCYHFCDDLKDFRSAGRVMLAFGIISMLLTGLAVVRFMMLLMHYPMCLRGYIVRGAMIGGAATWALGTIVYGGLYGKVHNKHKDSLTGPGLQLAIFIAVLQLVMCTIGMVGVKKLPVST